MKRDTEAVLKITLPYYIKNKDVGNIIPTSFSFLVSSDLT